MSEGWIRWSQWSDAGMVDFGQMPTRDVAKYLRKFAEKAREILKESDADHVVYGFLQYGESKDFREVKFYLQPMDDERFQKDVATLSSGVVYAVHKQ